MCANVSSGNLLSGFVVHLPRYLMRRCRKRNLDTEMDFLNGILQVYYLLPCMWWLDKPSSLAISLNQFLSFLSHL